MPTDARTLSLIRDVRDLQRRARRHQVNGISGMPIWKYDNFTLTGSTDTTHTLSYLPYGINVLALNGLGLVEGVDYSCDYTTGVVTLTATLTAGDVLAADYVTTGALMVASTPADTGGFGMATNWAISSNQAVLTGRATGTHFIAVVTTGTPANTVTVKPVNGTSGGHNGFIYAAVASGSAYAAVTIDNYGAPIFPSTLTLGYNYADGTTTTSGSLYSASISAQPTLGAIYNPTTGVLSVTVNGTTVNSTTVSTSTKTALASALYAGVGGLNSNDGAPTSANPIFDVFVVGSITDSFNRANQTGLGTADTGQSWSYFP